MVCGVCVTIYIPYVHTSTDELNIAKGEAILTPALTLPLE